jgi:hypothetical protein
MILNFVSDINPLWRVIRVRFTEKINLREGLEGIHVWRAVSIYFFAFSSIRLVATWNITLIITKLSQQFLHNGIQIKHFARFYGGGEVFWAKGSLQ